MRKMVWFGKENWKDSRKMMERWWKGKMEGDGFDVLGVTVVSED